MPLIYRKGRRGVGFGKVDVEGGIVKNEAAGRKMR